MNSPSVVSISTSMVSDKKTIFHLVAIASLDYYGDPVVKFVTNFLLMNTKTRDIEASIMSQSVYEDNVMVYLSVSLG